jgi:hypothetical protein
VSQPNPFNRSFSFTNFQAANPSLALPGSQVDLELNNAKTTLDGVLTNLKQIQRDDGALKNGSVTYDTLSGSLQTAGLAPALPWVTGTAYAVSASVTHGSAFYRCLVAHTAGTFATDLANGQWILIVDFSTIALVAARLIAVTPSGSLTTNVQTSLQALDTGKAPLSHTQLSSTISDSTSAGRAILTAADVPTQQTLLGMTVLGFQPGDVKETACPVLQTGWYYCDGSNKNRATDAALFNAITIQQSGVLTSASAVVTNLADTSNMSPGMPVSAAAGGVPTNTVIQSVDSSTQITMSANATASATTALVFAPYGVGDGSTTFGLPNRAYVAVGRDNARGSAANVMQVSTSISTTSGSAAATVASATGLFVGMYVSHPKVPNGTTLLSIVGTSITMSANATATVSASAARFSPVIDAQTLGAKGGELGHVDTSAEMPNHGHTATSVVDEHGGHAHAFGQTVREYGNGGTTGSLLTAQFGNGTDGSITIASALTGITVATTNTSTGGGLPHNNQPKTIVMNFMIKR